MVTAWLGVIPDPPSEGRPRKVRTRDSFKQMLQIGERLQVRFLAFRSWYAVASLQGLSLNYKIIELENRCAVEIS